MTATESTLLHFEDMEVGRPATYGAYEVTREEIIEYARVYDPQPHHIDEDAAMQSLTRGLCASGWHSCAMFMRMHYDGFLSRYNSLGASAIDEVRWSMPVRPGFILKARTVCIEKRVSRSRPDVGLCRMRHELFNQNDQLLMTMELSVFMRVRNPALASGGAA